MCLKGEVSTNSWWHKLLPKGRAQVQTVEEIGFGVEVTLHSQLFEIICLKHKLPHRTMVIQHFSSLFVISLFNMFAFLSML